MRKHGEKANAEDDIIDDTIRHDPCSEFRDVQNDRGRVSKIWAYYLLNKMTNFVKCRVCGIITKPGLTKNTKNEGAYTSKILTKLAKKKCGDNFFFYSIF